MLWVPPPPSPMEADGRRPSNAHVPLLIGSGPAYPSTDDYGGACESGTVRSRGPGSLPSWPRHQPCPEPYPRPCIQPRRVPSPGADPGLVHGHTASRRLPNAVHGVLRRDGYVCQVSTEMGPNAAARFSSVSAAAAHTCVLLTLMLMMMLYCPPVTAPCYFSTLVGDRISRAALIGMRVGHASGALRTIAHSPLDGRPSTCPGRSTWTSTACHP